MAAAAALHRRQAIHIDTLHTHLHTQRPAHTPHTHTLIIIIIINSITEKIAAALQAEKLILMTDVPGVLRDKDDVSTKFAELSVRECRDLVEQGVIAGGMIPKVQCCIRCVSQGVTATHIIDGRSRHSVLMELLTDEGVGTMITG